MIVPQHVDRVHCKFLDEFTKYLTTKKLVVRDPDNTELLKYWLLSTALFWGDWDCLDPDAVKCTQNLPEPSSCPETILLDCSDIDITLSQNSSGTCTVAAYLSNTPAPGGSSFLPKVILNNNSPYIGAEGYVGFSFSNSCNTSAYISTLLSSESEQMFGKTSAGGFSVDNLATYRFGFNSTSPTLGTTLITGMRVYKTNSTGTLDGYVDLDLDPTTSPYYEDGVDCPSCTTVDPLEIHLGHPNFSSNFGILMDNVSLALFGVSGQHYMEARGVTTTPTFQIRCTALHNPSSYWFGLHRPDARLTLSTGVVINGINAFHNTPNSGPVYSFPTPIKVWLDSDDVIVSVPDDFPCIDVVAEAIDQNTLPNIDTSASSFNFIKLNSQYATPSIKLTAPTSSTCGNTILTAVVTTDYDDLEYLWVDPSSNEVGTTLSVPLPEDYEVGTYTFYAFNNSCEESATINVI